MKLSKTELLFIYSIIKKKMESQGRSCEGIKKRIALLNTEIMKEAIVKSNRYKKGGN